MKKLILLASLLFASVAHGVIEKGVDEFDGMKHIKSQIIGGDQWENLVLMRASTFEGALLIVEKSSSEWWFFGNNIDLKIDGINYKVPIYKTSSTVRSGDDLMTGGRAHILPEVVDKIGKAKNIIMRVHFQDMGPLKWTVPKNVLGEWRTVANFKL